MSDVPPRLTDLPLADMPRYHLVTPHWKHGYGQFVKEFSETRYGVKSGMRLISKRVIREGAIFCIPRWFSWAKHDLKVEWNVFNPFWKAEESRPAHLNTKGRKTRYNMSLQSLDYRFFYVVITQDVQAREELCLDYGPIDDRKWDSRLPDKNEGKIMTAALVHDPVGHGFPSRITREMLRIQRLIDDMSPPPAAYHRVPADAPQAKKSKTSQQQEVERIDLTADSDSD